MTPFKQAALLACLTALLARRGQPGLDPQPGQFPPGEFFQAGQRHGEIMRLVQAEGTITVSNLAERLGVSLETVRRDVKPLADEGAVVKMHGAIGLPNLTGEAPFERRMRDAMTASQQTQGRGTNYVTVGRILMGLEPDNWAFL